MQEHNWHLKCTCSAQTGAQRRSAMEMRHIVWPIIHVLIDCSRGNDVYKVTLRCVMLALTTVWRATTAAWSGAMDRRNDEAAAITGRSHDFCIEMCSWRYCLPQVALAGLWSGHPVHLRKWPTACDWGVASASGQCSLERTSRMPAASMHSSYHVAYGHGYVPHHIGVHTPSADDFCKCRWKVETRSTWLEV